MRRNGVHRVKFKALPREHGTDRGYQQHRARNDMPACEACLAAHAIVTLANNRRRRLETVRCVECGEPAGRGRRRYCGEKCYALGKNRRERARDRRQRSSESVALAAPEAIDRPRLRWVKRGLVYVAQREREAS